MLNNEKKGGSYDEKKEIFSNSDYNNDDVCNVMFVSRNSSDGIIRLDTYCTPPFSKGRTTTSWANTLELPA